MCLFSSHLKYNIAIDTHLPDFFQFHYFLTFKKKTCRESMSRKQETDIFGARGLGLALCRTHYRCALSRHMTTLWSRWTCSYFINKERTSQRVSGIPPTLPSHITNGRVKDVNWDLLASKSLIPPWNLESHMPRFKTLIRSVILASFLSSHGLRLLLSLSVLIFKMAKLYLLQVLLVSIKQNNI